MAVRVKKFGELAKYATYVSQEGGEFKGHKKLFPLVCGN